MTDLQYENNRLLDIVNDNDEVVDSKSRADIHKLGLLHRQVHVWMIDENKNIFFQKRGLHSPTAGLLDATVGGHVNKDESYLDAAIRETKEETGITVYPSDLIFIKKYKKMAEPNKDNPFATINNCIESTYIYKNPIKEEMLKKESGIPGGGFQKLSYKFLLNPEPKYVAMFHKFVFKEELPHVLKHINELHL